MSLSAKAGSFALRTSTGSQAVTGVGFQPKAIVFFMNQLTADGSAVNAYRSIGFAVSSTQRGTVCLVSLDAQATSDSYKGSSTTRCIRLLDTAGTVVLSVDFVSMDADGFTISVATSDATAYIVNYLALGGADLTDAFVGSFATGGATGDVAVTGVGFMPDAILTIGAGLAPGVNAAQTLGLAAASTSAAMANRSRDGQATMDSASFVKSGDVYALITGAADTLYHEATLKSMDADGFTVTFGINGGSSYTVVFLALKGGQYKAGVDTQATSATTKGTTGVGFTPAALLLMSVNLAASTAVQAGCRSTLGIASGITAQATLWCGDSDNVPDSLVDSDLDRGNVIEMMTEGTPTLDAEAHLESFDSDGFTLHWTTADAVAREFAYLAVGSVPPVAGTGAVSGAPAAEAGSGKLSFLATAAVVATAVLLAAGGSLGFSGTGALSGSPAATSATGKETFSASGGAISAPPASLAGQGKVAFKGSGAVVTPPAAFVAAGVEHFSASGGLSGQPPSLSGIGTVAEPITGTGALTAPAGLLTGIGAQHFRASISEAAQAARIAGVGSQTFSGSGGIIAPPAALSGQEEPKPGEIVLSEDPVALLALAELLDNQIVITEDLVVVLTITERAHA
jgi:hypothetical protein